MNNPRFKGLSLFANVGISETYFHDTDVKIEVANELIKDRAEFYKELYPGVNMISGDITDDKVYNNIVTTSLKKQVDFILATPPCQGMSMANAKRADKDDPRNSLIKKVIQITKKLNPKYVLIENVPGMASEKVFIFGENGEKTNILPYINLKLGNSYNIECQVMNAADYKTPHNRKRLILLISRKDVGLWRHPKPIKEKTTVREAIGHLPSLESGQDSNIKWHSMKYKIHNKNHIKWIENTPSGSTAFDNPVHFPQIIDKNTGLLRKIKGFRTTYKRMDWDKVAPTVTMMNGSINSQNNCHPGRLLPNGLYSDARVLTIKELLFIVGLPKNWVDSYEHTQKRENFLRKVIGECFPPKMSKIIIENIPK